MDRHTGDWTMTVPGDRIDWIAERERVDMVAVATQLLGAAAKRSGQWHLWKCPFHAGGLERTPSFSVKAGTSYWRCFGCGEHGDAANLLVRIKGCTFPEAIRELLGQPARNPTRAPRKPPEALSGRPAATADRSLGPTRAERATRTPGGSGASLDARDALALVEAAAALWSPEGAAALDYLRTARGLTDETIRRARLGWTGPVSGLSGRPEGICIPWFDRGRLALLKIRQPKGDRSKYRECYRDPGSPPELYPSPEAVHPRKPLIITEGELGALIVG